MSDLRESLLNAGFEGKLVTEAPLAPFTTWRIGGPAELLAYPDHELDLERALSWALEHRVPSRVLGNGSNLLVADAGVRGLVLRIRKTIDTLRIDGERLVVGAGASFPALARKAASLGLAGIEFGGGIPGTLGGALVMNAGWHEFEIGRVVESVTTLDRSARRRTRSTDECRFAYRDSVFRGSHELITSATLTLLPGDKGEIGARLRSFAESRKLHQPTDQPSCGSVFLKPPGDFAGRLIDAAELKGRREGPIEISPKHANFFVNHGGGSAEQVWELVRYVTLRVEERFGVRLEREFEYWS